MIKLPGFKTLSTVGVMSAILLALMVALCVPAAHAADDADSKPEQTEQKFEPGFFGSHPILTELIGFPLFLLIFAGSMASSTRTERVTTEHWDWWGTRPLARSHTYVKVPQTPASSDQIKSMMIFTVVGYALLRFTCLFGPFNVLWQMIGGLVDIFFGLFFSIFISVPP